MKTVNILGTEYTIEIVKVSECELLKKNNWCGSCNGLINRILIGDPSEEEVFGVMSEEEQKLQIQRTLRHEIVHAFFNESGLQDDALVLGSGWAKNEEMVDWLAIQSPKLFQAFKEVDCL